MEWEFICGNKRCSIINIGFIFNLYPINECGCGGRLNEFIVDPLFFIIICWMWCICWAMAAPCGWLEGEYGGTGPCAGCSENSEGRVFWPTPILAAADAMKKFVLLLLKNMHNLLSLDILNRHFWIKSIACSVYFYILRHIMPRIVHHWICCRWWPWRSKAESWYWWVRIPWLSCINPLPNTTSSS